ncbi:hypothetical protein K1X45_01830 [Pseudochrobactrum sp. Wa41.01b-1]|uniref:hypothetical protein n=1 Tax=Pseudochrobactrum sp. Wa41.01b-1 TaxID=2864102 RepID=UPI001C68B60D|nr:hypothetical protein [Pseudochrobactrum sp. Wa41.01b-1]QYM73213.1 hypothetical protein K1X45_01830 [Pseudochrobactrum sp. Wa41.01b-1]
MAVISINAISSARHHIADAGFIVRVTYAAALALVAVSVVTPAQAAGSDQPALNPAPSQGYEFTVTLAEAPGPFKVVTAGAQYDAENYARCGKLIPLAGTISRATSHQEIKLTKISDTTYRGIVYADQLIDESYYGRDVCHWKLTNVSASFKANADNVSTTYIMSLPANLITAEGTDTRYFWEGYYPRAKMERFRDFGDDSLKEAVRREHGDEFFSITMSAKKISAQMPYELD